MTRTKNTSFTTIGKSVAEMSEKMKKKDEIIKELLEALKSVEHFLNYKDATYLHKKVKSAIEKATITP